MRTRPSRRVCLLAVAVVLAAGGAACSKSSSKAESPPATTTTTAPPATYPLTGLPVTSPANATRPALSIKIDNVSLARPQAGVDAADVVYEEIVEGGLTRLVGVYQSTDADSIGPVRSVRPTDPDLVAPFGGVFGYSGGAERFDTLIRSTPGITAVSAGDDKAAYPNHGPHTGDHTAYTSTAALYAHAAAGSKPPPPFSPFLKADQPFGPAGAVPATSIALTVGSQPVGFDFDAAARTWKRTMDGRPDLLQNGSQIASSNVIIEFVPEVAVGATDAIGSQVYEAKLQGTGEAWVLSDGKIVKGTWSKSSLTALTTFADAAGAPIALTPGRTFVELPEPGAPTTVT
ncbi:MAG: DUF3048 domain-containing protein [Actinomycetota bacterium]|nr:DUF3048 domain-containing protein [Actinomycetota bacterium]